MRVLSVVEKSEHANLRNPDSYRVPGSPERSQERVFLPSQLRLYVAHLMAKFAISGTRSRAFVLCHFRVLAASSCVPVVFTSSLFGFLASSSCSSVLGR